MGYGDEFLSLWEMIQISVHIKLCSMSSLKKDKRLIVYLKTKLTSTTGTRTSLYISHGSHILSTYTYKYDLSIF